jgi:hypothetical protein
MQTLTLLSEIGRVQRGVQEAVLVRPILNLGYAMVLSVSQPLHAAIDEQATREWFANDVLRCVEPDFQKGEEFELKARVVEGSRPFHLQCVPMVQEAGPDARIHWVCFVGEQYR